MTFRTSEVAVLLLKGFTKLVKQPCILDGNDGLRGVVLDQLDLLIGEGTHLPAVEWR